MRYDVTLLTDEDLHLFNEGTHFRLYEKLGAHPVKRASAKGTYFAVWAPNAEGVSVMGDFNGWKSEMDPLRPVGESGIWEGFAPGVECGSAYKYHVVSRYGGYRYDKADPFAFHSQAPPEPGSVVWGLEYEWEDSGWMEERRRRNAADRPISIYELHLGSWMRDPEEGNRPLTYRELAPRLASYLNRMNFTHVEFLPVMEHPFHGSWGYQGTGYFAPTSPGTPQDFMFLVDTLHRNGIGVLLDWVPSHFSKDGHGLAFFDGTHLYEHADPRQGRHPDWDTEIFNYGRKEVQSFLISSAFFWLDAYHADGLRVDAVASMLYLDYSRKEGEWIPNRFGGRENIDAIVFLRRFNEAVYGAFPDIVTVAEESTAWPMVSRPNYVGGLGFGMKWDMGWMRDTLSYMSNDPVFRKFHHDRLTFRGMYAFSENFVLPLSHDEVVHGKGSLLGKMPGDDWQKFANLRTLIGYMYAQPGKKLLFMGGEFGQWREWDHDGSLEWHLAGLPPHAGLSRWVEELNRFYRDEPRCTSSTSIGRLRVGGPPGHGAERDQPVPAGRGRAEIVLAVCNFTPVPRHNYRIGVPRADSGRNA
jgi:1,4-alpha-glucan branching enzyme